MRFIPQLRALTLLLLLLCSLSVRAAPTLSLQAVASGLANPIDIAHAGDGSGRLFIVQQAGQVKILAGATVLATPFLNIESLIVSGGERGLLGIAFHPNYSANGLFYINYTRQADGATVIARYRRSTTDPNIADPASASILLVVPQPFANHNGGQLRFGPDGFLYIGLGDGGSGFDPGNRAQNLNTLLGKMLRIDVNNGAPYAIPAGNPFQSDGNPNTLGEIWAYGLRNPWRFSFDRLTGDLFIADVGQNAWEEMNFQAAGSAGGVNYGWRVMEGAHCTGLDGGPACFSPSLTLPIIEYDHSLGCSITGGHRYRGTASPALSGYLIYGDFCSGRIWGATRDEATGAWTTSELTLAGFNISTFGEDQAGELYVADYNAGVIYRISAASATSTVVRADFNGDGQTDLVWQNDVTGQIGPWFLNGVNAIGMSLFSPGQEPDTNWKIAATGDFNLDGKPDLVWQHNVTGEIRVWFMIGITKISDSLFNPPQVADTNWKIVGTGDFNSDGQADLVWQNNATGDIGVWFLNGITTIGMSLFSPGQVPDTNWKIAATGDFNLDGKPDLVWQRNVTGEVGVWFMNGTTKISDSLFNPSQVVDTNWKIVGSGDSNSDGQNDLIWQNNATGQIGVWFMNGITAIGMSLFSPGQVSDTNWKIRNR